MGSEWAELKLSELSSKITKGTTPTRSDGGYSQEGVNFLKAEAITDNGNIDHSKLTYVSEGIHEKYRRSQLEENDILFSMAGVLGRSTLVKKEFIPANTNQAIALIRPITDHVFPKYLFYALRHPELIYFVNNSTSQSAQPNINLAQIGDLRIKPPPLPEQKAIAHVLGSLDDKIDLNRRMNETLEEMAKALFKSWFVDFDPVIDNALAAGNPIPEPLVQRAETRRQALANGSANRETAQAFPASFRFTEELGWIPEGWEVLKLNEVCERIFSGGTPRTKETSYWNGDIPWLSSGETGQRFILRTEKTITKEGVENSSTRQTRKGSVVIASAGQGKTRGQTSYLCFDSYINQSVIALETNNTLLPDSFLFFDLARRYEEFRQISDAHSSRGSLTTKLLAEIDVVTPSGQSLSKFGTYAGESINKISRNAVQAEELSKLRDVLLPKLISGELRIPQAEKMVKEAVA